MAKKRGPKPSDKGPMGYRVTIKCHGDYHRWVERFAEHRRVAAPALIDIALAKLAELDGFEPPPKR